VGATAGSLLVWHAPAGPDLSSRPSPSAGGRSALAQETTRRPDMGGSESDGMTVARAAGRPAPYARFPAGDGSGSGRPQLTRWRWNAHQTSTVVSVSRKRPAWEPRAQSSPFTREPKGVTAHGHNHDGRWHRDLLQGLGFRGSRSSSAMVGRCPATIGTRRCCSSWRTATV